MVDTVNTEQSSILSKIRSLPELKPRRPEEVVAPAQEAAPADAASTTQEAPATSRPQGPANTSNVRYSDMPSDEYWSLAASNVPKGLENVASGLKYAVQNPIEFGATMGSLGYDLAKGVGSKAVDAVGEAVGSGPVFDPQTKAEREAVADAAFNHFSYLSDKEEFWKRLAEDPVSIGLDVATFAPVAGAAGRAAGLGKLATGVERVAALGDPLNAAMQVGKLGVAAVTRPASVVARYPQVVAAGTPANALSLANRIGRSADPASRSTFRAFMSGSAEPRDVARAAVAAMNEKKQAVSNFYTSRKAALTTQELPMTEIRNALNDAMTAANRYGTRSGTPVVDALNAMDAKIRLYETHPNAGARTAVELDLLKRDLQDIVEQLPPSDRGAVASVPRSVRNTIATVDQSYADMMDYWQNWMSTMRDLQSTLGTGDRVSETSRLAKLMSTMKNGEKMNLLRQLEDTPSGKYLKEMIAGIAFRDVLPPTMQSFGLGILGPILAGGPHGIAAAAAASPRLAGLTQYGLGRLEGAVSRVPKVPAVVTNALYHTGHAEAHGGRVERKAGGRVGIDHERLADQLVGAAERAKKGISKGTEQLLDLPDDHIAHALELANRSI